MSALFAGLDIIWSFILGSLSSIFGLMITVPLLALVLGLWILNRIFGIFKLIKG